jgi:trans-2,3-dihydro-3-hydroxyanthranilate isomerase
MARSVHVLRVFTRGGEGGNHLGVVNDCIGLDDEMMQQIAADLGFSETAFVDWQPGEPPVVRIFTPGMELPFAGHPLVGTGHVMGRMGPGGVDRLRCGIGEVGLRFEGDVTWVQTGPLGEVAAGDDLVALAGAAGVPAPIAAYRVMMPLEYLIFVVDSEDAVASVAPDLGVLADHFGVLIAHRRGGAARVRFFAPAAGVPEDPATGSAAVALAAAMRSAGEEEGSVTIRQGEEMGHPSLIELRWRGDATEIGGAVTHDGTRFLEI